MSCFAGLVVVASSLLGQASTEKPQELQELHWLVGDWICKTTLWDDVDGIGNKGDEIEMSTTRRWALNGTILQEGIVTKKNGKVVDRARFLVRWHPAKEILVSWWFASVGTVLGEGEWSREGNTWTIKGPIVRSNGKESSGVWILKKVSDDKYIVGRTHLDGKKEPDSLMDEYNRVK